MHHHHRRHHRQWPYSQLQYHSRSSPSSSSFIHIRVPICLGVVLLCVSMVQLYVSTISTIKNSTSVYHMTNTDNNIHPYPLPLLHEQQPATTTTFQEHTTSRSNEFHKRNEYDFARVHTPPPVAAAEAVTTKPSTETSVLVHHHDKKNHPENHPNHLELAASKVETLEKDSLEERSSAKFISPDDAIANTKTKVTFVIFQPRVVQLILPTRIEPRMISTRLFRATSHNLNSSIRTPQQKIPPHLLSLEHDGTEMIGTMEHEVLPTENNHQNNATTEVFDRFNHIKALAMHQYMTECVPMVSWHTQSFPTCNTFHEMDIISDTTTIPSSSSSSSITTNDDISLLSDQGSWRSVWKVRRNVWWHLRSNHTTNDTNRSTTTADIDEETMVLKLLKFQRRDFDEESYHHHRIDAMAMERLTRSTHIVNIYGYCGQSVLTEYASTSARSLTKDKSLSSLDRLKLGRDIVQAMTHLHSIDYDNATNITMTHNDLNMANAVAVQQQIKLNDFNIGMVQRWNTTSQRICPTPVMFEAPLWKSPEEIMASTAMKQWAYDNIANTTATTATTLQSTEDSISISTTSLDTSRYWVEAGPTDVFGLGNLLFQVLTKCQPWTHLELDGPKAPLDAAQRKVRGEQPYVPDKYHVNTTTKVAYAALHYAVILCYQPLPQHRPTSHELLVKLNTAIEWIEDVNHSKKIRVSELKELFLPVSSSSSSSHST